MSNLIPMDEAARILGMTVEQVSELRSDNEIFGYKDGTTWKFKMSELERVAGERDIKLNMSEAANVASDLSESFGFDLSESSGLLMDDESSVSGLIEDLDSAEYIEDSSVELAQPDSSLLSVDSDSGAIDLDESSLRLADSGLLDDASDTAKSLGSANVLDDDEDELSFGSSSLKLASDSAKLTEDNDLASKSSVKASDSGMLLGGDDDDLLLADSGDDFTFGDDSSSFEDSAELGSDFEDSGSLILDDSDSGQEITLEANESGINLAASSSGISLAESGELDLGASDIDALDLPDDSEEIVILDDDEDSPMMLEEDDFNLTPLDNPIDEEDDTSGSQVIALEDSGIYADDSAATILGEDGFEPVAQDAGFDAGFGDSYDDGGFDSGGFDPSMTAAGAAMAPVIEEAPYSIFQIISLGGVMLLMLTGGMVAYNLAQNLWLPSDQVVGESVLTFFLRMVGAAN